MEYLFTDKTGTLTENSMVFRCCSVNGVKYEDYNGQLIRSDSIVDNPELSQEMTEYSVSRRFNVSK